MAKEFNSLGYSVLTIDFRGFNESEDPKKIDSIEDLDYPQDVISGIDFLIKKTNIDTSKIFIVGHSFGAGIAIQTRYNKAKKIVLFGPPRRVRDRVLNPFSPEREKLFYKKFIAGMKLNFQPDSTIVDEVWRSIDPENYIEDLNRGSHLPLFFIDCDGDGYKDRRFLQKIVSRINQPVFYWTMYGQNHYLNTDFFFGRAAYDKSQFEIFCSTVDNWLRDSSNLNIDKKWKRKI